MFDSYMDTQRTLDKHVDGCRQCLFCCSILLEHLSEPARLGSAPILKGSSAAIVILFAIVILMTVMMSGISGQWIRRCRWKVWKVLFSWCTVCLCVIPLGSEIMPQLVGFLASSSTSLSQSSCPPPLIQLLEDSLDWCVHDCTCIDAC